MRSLRPFARQSKAISNGRHLDARRNPRPDIAPSLIQRASSYSTALRPPNVAYSGGHIAAQGLDTFRLRSQSTSRKRRIPLFLQRPESPPTWSKLELTLANSVHEFQPSQSDGRRPIGLEAQHGAASSLDRPMILLYDIVQVLALAYQDVFPPMILSTKSAQTQMTGFVSIQRDFPRPSWRAERNRLAKKGHSRSNTAPRLEQGVRTNRPASPCGSTASRIRARTERPTA